MDVEKELSVINRFLEARFKNALCVAIYNLKEIIGFSIFSFHSNDYVVSHFTKANTAYKGIYEFLLRESASLLNKLGYKFLNHQEDMGLPGLREAKKSYRPVKFLKKYTVTEK